MVLRPFCKNIEIKVKEEDKDMIQLFFGNVSNTWTTITVLMLIIYFVYAFRQRESINTWGRHILIATLFGLYVCYRVSSRDFWHLSVQNIIDGSSEPGLFKFTSVQSLVNLGLGTLITLSSIISIFCRKQNVRKTIFFIIATSALIKICIIELSRIFMAF